MGSEGSAAPNDPKLQHGTCEEHGIQKMHFCIKHDKAICSECVLAYHKDGGCCTIPIKQYVTNKKTDLYKKLDSHLTVMQVSVTKIDKFLNVCKDVDVCNKAEMEKLLEEFQKKMNI